MGHEIRHHKLKHLHNHHKLVPRPLHTTSRTEPPQFIGPPPLGYPPIGTGYAGAAATPYNYNPAPPISGYAGAVTPYNYNPALVQQQDQQLQQALADVKRHSRNERIGEVGAAAAGAFALYELHEAKVDPEHARRHKLEAKLAGAVAVGSANYAYHEHLEKKKSEHLVEALSGRQLLNLDKKKKNNDKQEAPLMILGGHKHSPFHSKKEQNHTFLKIMSGDHNHKNDSKHRLW